MAKNLRLAALAVLCFAISSMAYQSMETFTASYGASNFNSDEFVAFAPADNSDGVLDLTPTSESFNGFGTTHSSGRIMLRKPFKLFPDDLITSVPVGSRNPRGQFNLQQPSFNTSFLISIYPFYNISGPGEGMTFFIGPALFASPDSSGQYLGLTNSRIDAYKDNKIVAVEFDIHKQYFDPDDNHVGLDIRSIKSVKTEYLTPHNITLSSPIPKFHNVWVDYDGVNRVIQVFIAEQKDPDAATPPKPQTPILSSGLNLTDYVEYSYFGFSASTGNYTYANRVLRWNLTVHHFPCSEYINLAKKLNMMIKILVPTLLLLVATWAGYYVYKKRQVFRYSNLARALESLPGMPREFQFGELKKATNNFSDNNKLGEGGFGVVYKGILAREGKEIAVKWFTRESSKGHSDFLAELTIINRLRHRHLVRLLGWCHKNGILLLVYEYMPNGSLDTHLFIGPDHKEALQWSLRYKIITEVALAIDYLHNGYEVKVVHRDLKASNIMLDAGFNARLGDFGLARALDNGRTSYLQERKVTGTRGYIAPECYLTGKTTRESDIYAFGGVLLETVCARRPGTKIGDIPFLVDWVWLLHRDGRLLEGVDQKLGGGNYVVEEAERLLLLGLACSHPVAAERPNVQDIIQMLSATMPVPNVPPIKPDSILPPIEFDTVKSSVISRSVISVFRDKS